MPDLLRQSGVEAGKQIPPVLLGTLQKIDLGAWAEEKYAIPAAPPKDAHDEE
jgi:hypothetical protein